MPKPILALPPTEPDIALLARLTQIECIASVAAITAFVLELCGWVVVQLGWSFPGREHLMNAETASVALLCALSLLFSSSQSHPRAHRIAELAAAVVTLVCVGILCGFAFHATAAAGASSPSSGMSPQAAVGFGLLGISLTMIRVRKRPAAFLADALVFSLLLVVLILVSAHVIAQFGILGSPAQASTSTVTILSLLLLTAVALLRKAEHGVFSILLDHGIGSNIARGLAPVLLVVPYLREFARARLVGTERMPPVSTTAILASTAFILSFSLLLFLAWRINAMEVEIRELSLRDALTDLYNLRGFRLLAEQALRMARRSNLPFSVLFIDLDGLKNTNDSFGHQAGSDLLVETGRILRSSFREIDVVARIGGDEFAVAGQFSQSGIGVAAHRIEECVVRRNEEQGHPTKLSFSIGYITAESAQQHTLEELLAQADAAMYQQKRRKKQAAR